MCVAFSNELMDNFVAITGVPNFAGLFSALYSYQGHIGHVGKKSESGYRGRQFTSAVSKWCVLKQDTYV